MAEGSFRFLEPSKVGTQHISLIENYLVALLALDLPARGLRLVYRADPSSHAALSPAVRSRVPLEPIAVIDADSRRWVAKGLQEFWSVLGSARRTGPSDVLLVSCMTAPATLLLELFSCLFGRGKVVLVLHSEMEALLDPSLRSPRSYGFWAWVWTRLRRQRSPLQLAAIDGFIRDALLKAAPAAFAPDRLHVLPFPVTPMPDTAMPDTAKSGSVTPHRVIFIGYKTRFKGFESFRRVAERLGSAGMDFAAIGGGKVEDVPSGVVRPFASPGDFLGEVAAAAAAVFPYERGYAASLSAAALDAVSAGVVVLATRRPCFVALQAELGSDAIALYDTEDELVALLERPGFLETAHAGAAARRVRLAASPYGAAATAGAFDRMLSDFGFPAAPAPRIFGRVPLENVS